MKYLSAAIPAGKKRRKGNARTYMGIPQDLLSFLTNAYPGNGGLDHFFTHGIWNGKIKSFLDGKLFP